VPAALAPHPAVGDRSPRGKKPRRPLEQTPGAASLNRPRAIIRPPSLFRTNIRSASSGPNWLSSMPNDRRRGPACPAVAGGIKNPVCFAKCARVAQLFGRPDCRADPLVAQLPDRFRDPITIQTAAR